jgi:hypothetical protein
MGLVGASAVLTTVPSFAQSGPRHTRAEVIEANGWQLHVDLAGEIVSLTDGKLQLVNQRTRGNQPRIVVADLRLYPCTQPSRSSRSNSKLTFEYHFSGPETLSVVYEIELVTVLGDSIALKQRVAIHSPARIAERVRLELPRNIQLPFQRRSVFLPMKNGIGRFKPVMGYEGEDEYVFSFAGDYAAMGKPQQLAIPMVDEYCAGTPLRLTLCADPYFSSYFFPPALGKMGQFNCVYLDEVGLEGLEERTIYTALHHGGAETAMEAFYACALPDVKPGPDWIHEIAMQNYDYLSKNGRGWFSDVETLTKLVGPGDRNKVCLALHGWYDYVGRYTFDARRRSLAREWTAFPSALEPRVQALGHEVDKRTGVVWHRKSVKAMRPVSMSIPEVHRRIQYGKERGFRVALYFSDATNACDALKDVFAPEKVLRWGGWAGPDTTGRIYAQNPLHPEVRKFYLDYIHALLEEYGKDVDGFIWDETFVVGPHDLGPPPHSGYASRAMMTLVKAVAGAVASSSPSLALFASDDIGAFDQFEFAAPYCLMAHGTYQDSWCTPSGWSYGLFPNYRNVLWSCNWAPVTRFEYTRYGVETYGVPVAISNGAFGDDMGISDMTRGEQQAIIGLFNERKLKSTRIGWITEEPSDLMYNGRGIRLNVSVASRSIRDNAQRLATPPPGSLESLPAPRSEVIAKD